jgi:predicted ArsR family transcriptional regulator
VVQDTGIKSNERMNGDLKEPIGDQVQPTRRKILLALKQHGGMTAGELAALLGITSMGVRRHLMTLERDRLVQYEPTQRGKGRPSYIYHLSQQAEEVFPKNYARLANELLGYLADEQGDEAIIHLFDQRAQRRIRSAQAHLEGLPLSERVAGLTAILNGEGYLAEWGQLDPETFWIREHNCAIHDIASQYSAACGSELSFIRAVLPDADVRREHHMMNGGLMCEYRIRQTYGPDV